MAAIKAHGVLSLLVLLLLSAFAPCAAAEPEEAYVVNVGTSPSIYATMYPFQRQSFYANESFWVFYSDGANIVYSTSTNGTTWTTPTAIRACVYGQDFSTWFDGTYLHYAYAYNSSIYYRRGTPNNGSIIWSAAEQVVLTTYNRAYYPTVSVDNSGYVWIGYRDCDGTYYYPFVIRSGNNDGTWGTTPVNFPYRLSATSLSWRVSVIPLTAGKMLAIYVANGRAGSASCWNGSVWMAEVATTSNIRNDYTYSAVAQGDDVHLVFLKSSGYDIVYTKYTYSNNSFGMETTLQAGATSTSVPVISINDSYNLYVFWAGYPAAGHIYCRKYIAGNWEPVVDWIDESAYSLAGNNVLTSFYKQYGDYVGLVYITKTTSPYDVKLAFIRFPPPDVPTATVYNQTIAHFTLYSTNPFPLQGSWDGTVEGKLTFVTHGDVNITSSQGWYFPFTVSHDWQYWTEWEYANPPDMIRIYGLPDDTPTTVDFTLPREMGWGGGGGGYIPAAGGGGGYTPPVQPPESQPEQEPAERPGGNGGMVGEILDALPEPVRVPAALTIAGLPVIMALLLLLGKGAVGGRGGRRR